MLLPLLAVVLGLMALVFGARRFVEGAALTARYAGVSPLLIGLVIVGFGTSAPELLVSGFSAAQGNPGIALGNAYGSNIANIALILGVTALISPIPFQRSVLGRELPALTVVTALAALQLLDLRLSRADAAVLLAVFSLWLAGSVLVAVRKRIDPSAVSAERIVAAHPMSRARAVLWLVVGFVVLMVGSRVLVWGVVEVARAIGVSDLAIGLTVVAVGTSLPELASSVIAARRNEHDIALGNVLGSNLFNTLAVVGLAGAIEPMAVERISLLREFPVMSALTLSLFAFGWASGRHGVITRAEGALLLLVYVGYIASLVATVIAAS